MFSLIITIISIALVAVLALATLYYGGDAFNKGTADAQAAKVINQGQQLLAASELYAADAANAGQPMTMARLISGGYLKSVPVAYQGNGSINEAWAASAWAMPTDGQPVFVATLDSAKACQTVNKRSLGEDVLLTQAFPNLITQCYEGADDQLRAVVSKNASSLAAVAAAPVAAIPDLLPITDISGTDYASGGSTPVVSSFTASGTLNFQGNGTQSVVFTNEGATPAVISAVTLAQANSVWTVTAQTCTVGATVAPGATCSVTLTSDNSMMLSSGTLTVATSAGDASAPLAFGVND